MKTFLFLIMTLLTGADGYGGQVVIKYIVAVKPQFNASYYLNMVDAGPRNDMFIHGFMDDRYYKKRTISKSEKDSAAEMFYVRYEVDREGCYFMAEGTGREILLRPDNTDTIVIHVSRRPSLNVFSPVLQDSIMTPCFLQYSVDEKHTYLNFFDSLATLYGDINVRMVYSFKSFKHDLNAYLSYITRVYKDRLAFLQQFSKRHYFPARLRFYAYKEIQYSFYDDLLDPIVYFRNSGSYPRHLLDSLDNITRDLGNTDLFDNTSLYRKVLLEYLFHLRVPRGDDYWSSDHLEKCYDHCKHDLKGRIRDYAMACLLTDYLRHDQKDTVQQAFLDYRQQEKRSSFYPYIDSVKNTLAWSGDSKNPGKRDLLSIQLENDRHERHTLASVISSKLIVVDCWATWCLPCIEQIPSLDTLAAKYQGKVQFISVSGDQSIIKWDQWLLKDAGKHKNILQLHDINDPAGGFFRSFSIAAIPRFILLTDAGKVLEAAMPSPGHAREKFETLLRKHLNEYGQVLPVL